MTDTVPGEGHTKGLSELLAKVHRIEAMTVSAQRDRLIHILVVHYDMFRDKAEEAADLFLHDQTLSLRSDAHTSGEVKGAGGKHSDSCGCGYCT